jgi:hypothetical protein
MYYSSDNGNIMDVRNFAMHNGSHVGKETAVSLESGIHYTFTRYYVTHTGHLEELNPGTSIFLRQ